MFRTLSLLALLSFPAWDASVQVHEASASAIIGTIMPGFYNGYLFSAEPRHVLTLFAPDGNQLFSLPLAGRDNGKVAIESVAIDSDRTLAVAWQDAPNAGIDIRDLSGKLTRSIDTGLFIPAHLSFGPDHSLWALGWQRDKNDYPILRRYSIDGQETGAFLSRSLFAAGLPPGMKEWQRRRITVTADRVGVEVVSGTIGTEREWVELDLDGNVKGRWKMDAWDRSPAVAFTSDDQAYVQRYNRGAKSMEIFRLNRATSTWDLAKAPNLDLYGADGDKLVFAHWSDSVMHLSWFPQP
jgi:hypothetical protein